MSDQDTDVFGGNDLPPAEPMKYEDLVGDGKKYRDNDAVAHALTEKDRHIKNVEHENAEMRAALSKRINEEEFLKKLQEVARPTPPEIQDPPVEPGARTPEASALTPEKVEEMMAQREAANKRKSNLDSVSAKLQEVFGNDFRSRVQAQAQKMGVGTEFLTSVAAESPAAFYRFMGLDEAPRNDVFSAPPRPSMSTTSMPTQANKKNYAYYQKLRSEKGDAWYFSIPVQQEIWQTAKEFEARGEDFLPK